MHRQSLEVKNELTASPGGRMGYMLEMRFQLGPQVRVNIGIYTLHTNFLLAPECLEDYVHGSPWAGPWVSIQTDIYAQLLG